MNAWRSFIDGLLRPSMTAVCIALALAGLIVAGALFALTPQRLVPIIRWHQQYDFNRINDAQFITANGIEFHDSGGAGPGIVLLGGSTMRESVDVPYLRSRLEGGGHQLQIEDLTFSAQRVIDTIALIDFIPEGFRGIVVVGVNPVRIGGKTDVKELIHSRRIGILGPTLIEEAGHWPVEQPATTGFYAWDNRRFLLALWKDIVGILPGLATGNAKRVQTTRHFYLDMPPPEEKWLLRHFEYVSNSLSNYDTVAPLNLAALARMQAYLRERGMRMVLVETPVNPRFLQDKLGKTFYTRHIEGMERFAKEQGIPYLQPGARLDVPIEHYHDWAHFRTASAQYAFTEKFERQLQPILKESH